VTGGKEDRRDSPEQARERERQLESFRKKHGDEWARRNRNLLDDAWEYLRDLDLI